MNFVKAITAAALAISTCTAAWAQEYPRLNIRLAHAFPATWAQTKVDQWWADEIRKRSADNIRITIMWAGSGGEPLEILKLVASGAVLTPFTPEVMDACYKASHELYAEISAKNPAFKELWDSQKAFRDDANLWLQVAEYTMDSYAIRYRNAQK